VTRPTPEQARRYFAEWKRVLITDEQILQPEDLR
jgi:hypothetical protein